MYQILLGDLNGNKDNNGNDSILYYPADIDRVLYDTKLSLEVGSAGTFEFVIPEINPLYSQIKQGSIVTILRDNEEFWRGEVQETSKDFNGNQRVFCIEDLAWLGFEYVKPSQILNETYAQRFQSAIQAYNENQTGTERTFNIGYITNIGNNELCTWTTQYEWSILDSIRECICRDTGYLRVRRITSNGIVTRYIDIVKLSDYGILATQPIRFAENLLDYVEEMDMKNFTNVIYPFGNELDTTIYEGANARLEGTVLSDPVSIEKYGRHARTVIFETDDINVLNNLAQAYISRYSQPQLQFELSAIDLADISSDTHINIGDSVQVVADPFGIDQRVYLTAQEIDLQDISKSTFSLSSYMTRGRTLTEQTRQATDALQEIPSKASFLDAAKKNALELLNGDNGGYVTFVTNQNDQIVELQIANSSDKDQATKKWVWNLGGLGFEYKDEDPESETFGQWVVADAMTMDGSIVADRITSGILRAIKIEGVTITGAQINTSTDGNISSVRTDGSTVNISGGSLQVINTDDSYLDIRHTNGHRVTLGGSRWGCYNGSSWRWFDPMKLFELVNNS